MTISKRPTGARKKVAPKKRKRKPDFEIDWHPSGAIKVTRLPSRSDWTVIASHLVPDYLQHLREKMAECKRESIRDSLADVIATVEAYRLTNCPVHTQDGQIFVAGHA